MNRAFEPVVEGITSRIVAGSYAAGERLPTEADLQAEWGVSRAVVREAMKTLASQGLVRIEQGRGTFVNENVESALSSQLEMLLRWRAPEQSRCDENAYLSDVRRVLEVAVAERAARHARREHIAVMESAIAELREHAGEQAGYVEADIAFHRALAEATANPLWPALLNSLNDLLRSNRAESYRGAASVLAAADQHQEILAAVKSGDSAAAVAAMQNHLQRSEEDLRAPKARAGKRGKHVQQ